MTITYKMAVEAVDILEGIRGVPVESIWALRISLVGGGLQIAFRLTNTKGPRFYYTKLGHFRISKLVGESQ